MAWELAREAWGRRTNGVCSIILAERYAWAVDRDEGLRLQQILPRIRRQEDSWTLAFALTELGTLHHLLHNLERQACLAEALALHRQAVHMMPGHPRCVL